MVTLLGKPCCYQNIFKKNTSVLLIKFTEVSIFLAKDYHLSVSFDHRWTEDSQWECSMSAMDFMWKKIALPVMEHYTEATDGSSIEQKESALVWHHQEADPDFGSCQAKELHDHLESVLANEPVVVKRGQHIVEVKAQV